MIGKKLLLSVSALYAIATLACAAPPAPPATPRSTPRIAAATASPTISASATPAPTPTMASSPSPAAVVTSTSVANAEGPSAAPRPRATIVRTPTRLQDAYAWAAKEFGVPVDILLAVSYNESRWEQHPGQPSAAGGYGVMHLTDLPGSDAPAQHTLPTAVKLLNALPDSPFQPTADDLKTDPYQNIRGGAALLQQYEIATVGKGERDNEADWYGAVAKYSGSADYGTAKAFADEVFATLARGMTRTTTTGEEVHLDAKSVSPNLSSMAVFTVAQQKPAFTPDCPPDVHCTAAPALYQLRDTNDPTDVGNYALADRPNDGMTIKYIVIHDTEESADGAVKTFQEPADETTANYIVRSADGAIIQVVPTRDVAYHARNWYFNAHAIGVEHEGLAVQGATWYTEAMYESSAKLVKYLAHKYGVPLDRAHIIGHDNVPGQSQASQVSMHWDPGPYWDWDHYMELLGVPVRPGSNPNIVTIHPNFAENVQTLAASCSKSGCADLPAQPSNFLWVHQAPSASAPLIADPATANLSPTPGQGTRLPQDWGDQASSGERFARIATQGDWDEIWFGGQKGWIYDPGHRNTMPGDGTLVRTRTDRGSLIPLYGQAFPEIQAYPNDIVPGGLDALTYLGGGQVYVATELVGSDYLDVNYLHANPADNKVVKGKTKYYVIYFNHRLAFLNADDVEVVG